MRPSPLMSSVLVIFSVGSSLADAADVRTVIVQQAEVRAGPSSYPDCYPTDLLPQGSQVEVINDAGNGWLAIKPPPRSFSWIDTRYVKQIIPTQPNFVVTVEGAGAPVLVGSWVRNERLTKINVHLAKGTQVRQIGRIDGDRDGQGSLMVIEPPLGELRYIRAEAVARLQTVGTAASGAALTALSQGQRPLADPTRPPPAPDADELWRQAEQAAARGRIREAIALYKLAGNANSSINPARSQDAFRHARQLEDAYNGVRPPADSFTPAPSYTPGATGYPPNARATPVFRAPIAATPVSYGTTPVVAGAGLPALANGSSEQTWTGKLVLSGRHSDGTTMFVLEATSPTQRLLYLIPHGVDLRRHLNKPVQVSGKVEMSQDVRASHMIVTAVQPLY